ncbi:cAMP-dependent protein kinase type 2 [Candidozyma auris]|nr:cAMP-dependent protein kinase type 2 [[Candida] auris]
MLTGYTPFYDPTPMKTYENILNGTITYPDYLPPDILDLLQKLIVKDLTQRLGNLQNGSDDVKNHPWFKEVIWERLLSRDIETPYEPPITSGVETHLNSTASPRIRNLTTVYRAWTIHMGRSSQIFKIAKELDFHSHCITSDGRGT